METTVNFKSTKIKRNLLYEQVYNDIIRIIIDEGLADGTKMPSERALSEQFGVSRVVIREAMKVLVKNGIVVVEPGRGTFIADQTSVNLYQALDLVCRVQGVDSSKVMEVRAPLEILAAGLAAERADQNDITALNACIKECEKNIKNINKFILADENFHLTLAAATKNELLIALIQPLVNLIQMVRVKTAGLPDAALSAFNHHKEVFEAVKAHDVKAAQEAMQDHMKITKGLLYKVVQEELISHSL